MKVWYAPATIGQRREAFAALTPIHAPPIQQCTGHWLPKLNLILSLFMFKLLQESTSKQRFSLYLQTAL